MPRKQTGQSESDFDVQMDSQPLKRYLSALDGLVDESIIRTTDGGFYSAAVDPANVAMVEAELGSDAFDTSPDDGAEFGVRTRTLADVLPDDESESVELVYEDDRRVLSVGAGPYRYSHSCIDPGSLRNRPDLPNLDLGFEASLGIDTLRNAVEWFDGFTDRVRVGYDPSNEEFWMEATEKLAGGKMGTDDGVFQLGRDDLQTVWKGGNADSNFSLDYFKDIVRAIPDGHSVTIQVGEEFPMKLTYAIESADGEPVGEVTFMQAPRIQSD